MSWRASAFVLDLRVAPNGAPITPGELLVLLVLACRHNPDFGGAYPKLKKVADDSRLTTRSCVRILNALEAKGVLRIGYGVLPGGKRGNIYRFVGLDPEQPDQPRRRRGGRPPGVAAEVTVSSQHMTPRHLADDSVSSREMTLTTIRDDIDDTVSPRARRTVIKPSEETTTAARVREDVLPVGDETPPVVVVLKDLGVDGPTATRLAATHDAALLRQLVAYATSDPDIRNRAGYVVASLQRGWQPPPDWLEAQQRQAERAQAAAEAEAQERAAAAAAEAERERIARLPPEEQVAGRLAAWTVKEQLRRGHPPPAEEIAGEQARLIAAFVGVPQETKSRAPTRGRTVQKAATALDKWRRRFPEPVAIGNRRTAKGLSLPPPGVVFAVTGAN